jgi:hypothetical protein
MSTIAYRSSGTAQSGQTVDGISRQVIRQRMNAECYCSYSSLPVYCVTVALQINVHTTLFTVIDDCSARTVTNNGIDRFVD